MRNIYESLIPTIPMNLLWYWSDSAIALSWIKNISKIYELYVYCRVSEIHKLCNPLNWHHIICRSNSANILSRGCLIFELNKLDFWFCRPKFLCTKFQLTVLVRIVDFLIMQTDHFSFCLLLRGEESSRELCFSK